MTTRLLAAIGLIALLVAPLSAFAQAQPYEVWAVDQADWNKNGARLYIYQGTHLGGSAYTGQPQIVDLEEASKGIGDGPGVRPHLLLLNKNHSHGALAYVASGHVQVIRTADRKVVASIDVGEQAHGALPSPDDRYILVANQNGKKLAKIHSDYAREQFRHNPAEDLNLGALENPNQPDNAPICPVMFVGGGGKAYVTVRGGGMYIVDTASNPMRILKTFSREQVAPAGCGGVVVGSKTYVNSGTATFGALYVFDGSDNLVKTINTTQYGTDAHGMAVVGGGRYLWMANRGDGDNMVVVDTQRDEIVGTFGNFGLGPDLMDVSPGGDRLFMTLRGPNNLTGGPPAKGETPGVVALSVQDGGLRGSRLFFIPIGPQNSRTDADPHALAVRLGANPQAIQLPGGLPRTGEGQIALALFGLAALALAGGRVLRARRAMKVDGPA